MAKEFEIQELGINVLFGKGEQLRYPSRVNIWDILSAGQNNGLSQEETSEIIAKQLYILKGGLDRYSGRPDFGALDEIVKGKKELPFAIAQTCLGIIFFNLDRIIDPAPFVDKNKIFHYRPNTDTLGIDERKVAEVANGPARLAGSALVAYYDGIDENTLLLGPRVGGFYDGRYTIPGGHADWPTDSFALHEVLEETGVDKSLIRSARPLGMADQVIFARGDSEKPQLVRYLNYLWEITVYNKYDKRLYKAEDMNWKMFDDDEIPIEKLTPIARIAIDMSGFPMWNPKKVEAN